MSIKTSPERKAELLEAYESDMDITEIMVKYKVSPATLRDIIIEAGVKSRKQRHAEYIESCRPKVLKMMEDGITKRKICEELHISNSTIAKLLGKPYKRSAEKEKVDKPPIRIKRTDIDDELKVVDTESKRIQEMMTEMYDMGMSIMQIAGDFSCSVSQVKEVLFITGRFKPSARTERSIMVDGMPYMKWFKIQWKQAVNAVKGGAK